MKEVTLGQELFDLTMEQAKNSSPDYMDMKSWEEISELDKEVYEKTAKIFLARKAGQL